MSRLVSNSRIVPGKYQNKNQGVYSVLNGTGHSSGIKEVLQITTGYKVSWLIYAAGDIVPSRAVVGGYLADGSGSDLYVIRGAVHGFTIPAFYNPSSLHGYVESHGPRTITQMDKLVLD